MIFIVNHNNFELLFFNWLIKVSPPNYPMPDINLDSSIFSENL